MVLMRAMSLRTCFTRAVFSSWPVAFWKRRLNCSFFRLASSSLSWSGVLVLTSEAFIAVPSYSAMRCTKRVLTESLAAPRRSASRAVSSVTPSISNMMRPGLTRAAQ